MLQIVPEDDMISRKDQDSRPDVSREIENLLMIHEKKINMSVPAVIPGTGNAEESDSSDSDAEVSQPTGTSAVGKYLYYINNCHIHRLNYFAILYLHSKRMVRY